MHAKIRLEDFLSIHEYRKPIEDIDNMIYSMKFFWKVKTELSISLVEMKLNTHHDLKQFKELQKEYDLWVYKFYFDKKQNSLKVYFVAEEKGEKKQ